MSQSLPPSPPHADAPAQRVPLSAQIAVGMVLGLVAGPFLGAWGGWMGEIAKLIIQLIRAVATPLLFLSIVYAVTRTQVALRAVLRLLFFASINTCIALTIGVSLSNLLKPGYVLSRSLPASSGDVTAYMGKTIDFEKTLVSYVPTDLVSPFMNNAVIGIVVLALLLGFGLRAARTQAPDLPGFDMLNDAVEVLLRVTEVILLWVIRLVPVAVFCSVARTIAQYGYAPLSGLALYVAVGLAGLSLHILVTYHLWLRFYARISLAKFWSAAREPVVYALGTNSSLATLPLTLTALRRLNVSKAASALGACVGTNFNNDGIVLYEGMALLFVAQALGIHLTLPQQLLATVSCLVAAMGVAGVPEAGFVSLALVLNTVGLPIELLPLLLGVDWVIARARSVTNVLSDMVLSILIDRSSTESDPLEV